MRPLESDDMCPIVLCTFCRQSRAGNLSVTPGTKISKEKYNKKLIIGLKKKFYTKMHTETDDTILLLVRRREPCAVDAILRCMFIYLSEQQVWCACGHKMSTELKAELNIISY